MLGAGDSLRFAAAFLLFTLLQHVSCATVAHNSRYYVYALYVAGNCGWQKRICFTCLQIEPSTQQSQSCVRVLLMHRCARVRVFLAGTCMYRWLRRSHIPARKAAAHEKVLRAFSSGEDLLASASLSTSTLSHFFNEDTQSATSLLNCISM